MFEEKSFVILNKNVQLKANNKIKKWIPFYHMIELTYQGLKIFITSLY